MELSEIREQINTVDEQLLTLFLQRMELSEAVAAYKNEHHLPILNKQREREILAILVPTEQRGAIMEAVNAEHGLRSEAQVIQCSLPVEEVVRI